MTLWKFWILFLIGSTILTFGCSSLDRSLAEKEKAVLKPKEQAYQTVRDYLRAHGAPNRWIFVPEGEFVSVFNPDLIPWLQKKWTTQSVRDLRRQLAPAMQIQLTQKGFVQAANRDSADPDAKDETNYDAVWVRDSAWVFWNLQESGKVKEARQLVLALWDYYSTPLQMQRFRNVINNPRLVSDKMAVPHIRFNGASPNLDDVMSEGKPEVWNHLQMDAHGLFLMSVFQGIRTGIIQNKDFTEERTQALALFTPFFKSIKFWQLEDAGAWEEINRRNTSSISIVTRSLMELARLAQTHSSLFNKILSASKSKRESLLSQINTMTMAGMATVRAQIRGGGESPLYDPYSQPNLFRRADAALFNVILPTPLPGLTEDELRLVLSQMESLKRPAGILRYQNDSYQSGNFWIQAPGAADKKGTAGTTGDTSGEDAFRLRLEALLPNTEAQWFFDSQMAMARLELCSIAQLRKDRVQAEQDLLLAQLHIKRALGQITGSFGKMPLITADGRAVRPWLIPESINSVVIDGNTFYLPSPITPLNWAKASLDMALQRLETLMPSER